MCFGGWVLLRQPLRPQVLAEGAQFGAKCACKVGGGGSAAERYRFHTQHTCGAAHMPSALGCTSRTEQNYVAGLRRWRPSQAQRQFPRLVPSQGGFQCQLAHLQDP